ncbi:MAG: rhodanese-like domain-containing protein [Verrucomicrobia bacterium]|jgi:phage shock protein E|nr:rhodanese-like domain-containing protein [Verrucomicrobiota bacterium]
MNWTIVWIVGIAIVAMILMKRASAASPEVLRKHLQEGALVIDVRSPDEFRGEHVPGALNIPLSELSEKLPQQVPEKDKVLLLHCLSGMRSRNGQRQLQRLGYTNVFNLGSLARAKHIVGEARNR